MPRIVALLPSATEIACALGFREALVGRSHECDHPPGVEALPACTESRIDAGAPGREIDAQVRRHVRDALSIYRVDPERLRALAPDVILTQDQCEVCAASLADVEAAVAAWTGTAPRVVSLHPRTLGDVWDDVERVGAALGAPERGRALRAELAARVDALTGRADRAGARARLACLEWIDPLMAAGNWVPELVERAGGAALFGVAGEDSPWIDWDALRDADPDAIAVLPCGFSMDRARREMGPLVAQPGWSDLRAVREGRVYLLEGSQYFNRPGPRLVESLEILAEILHPQAFPPTHRGTGWSPLGPA